MEPTKELATFVVNYPTNAIPDEIMHAATRCLVNYLGVTLYATSDPSADIVLSLIREEGGNGRASILGTGERTSASQAAFANGYFGHWADFDDTHVPIDNASNVHASPPIIPAALAAGQLTDASGKEVLAGVVLGMEVALRLSSLIGARRREGSASFHITATCGVIGAAAAAGRVLGLNSEQMTYGLGIAATQAAGLTDVFGSMCKPFHAGRAAQGGIVSAMLASKGFTSSTRILEAENGFIHAMADVQDLSPLTQALGEEWETPRIGFKPYACGAGNHGLIDALFTLRREHNLGVEDVESIVGLVHNTAPNLLRNRQPKTTLETKFSYHHAMAVAFALGMVSPEQFTEPILANAEIAMLRDRIEVRADESLKGRSCIVELSTKDGRTFSEFVEYPSGTPGNPMSDEALSDKFRGVTDSVLDTDQQDRLLKLAWDVQNLPGIDPLFTLTA